MAEIAKECGMSAGNIYRFFKGKIDIAEALAEMKHGIFLAQLKTLAENKRKSALTRLRESRVAMLEYSFNLLASDSKILEVAEALSEARPTHANYELARERVHLVRILTDGVEAGEFRPLPDPEFTAEMIQSATMKFAYPQLFSELNLFQLRRELDGVMDLIEAGLKA